MKRESSIYVSRVRSRRYRVEDLEAVSPHHKSCIYCLNCKIISPQMSRKILLGCKKEKWEYSTVDNKPKFIIIRPHIEIHLDGTIEPLHRKLFDTAERCIDFDDMRE